MMDADNSNATKKRIANDKKAVLDQLAKLPIVQIACQKTGIARATYYRWRIGDKRFAKDADKAIEEGVQMINDLSESQLITAIKNGNFPAVRFWLQNRHRAYTNKIEAMERADTNQELTAEQKGVMEEALKLASAGIKQDDTSEQSSENT